MTPVKAAPLFLFLLASATCGTWLATRAAAADGMEWQFYEENDPDNKGRMTARLVYAVPETDNVQVYGVCDASPSTGVKFSSLTFGADIGKLEANKDVELRFSGGGFDHALKGQTHHPDGEEDLSGVHVDVAHDDPLWQAMAEKESLDYLVPGYRAETLDFTRGRDRIKQFVEACRTYAQVILGGTADSNATPSGNDAGNANANKEKAAFESAKELGTIEAWDAFLASYASGFYADLARAYVKKLGSSSAPATSGGYVNPDVTGLNVTSVRYAKGTFVKNGADTWVEQGETGSAIFRFKETARSEREVKLFDASRKVVISLSVATGEILYGPDGSPLTKLYDIVATTGAEEAVTAPAKKPVANTPAPKPAAKKATTKPGCGKGHIVVDGKCMSRQKAAGYCGPGYRPQGGKCVQGYVAPKGPRPSTHGCPPGLVWNAQEGCHEDD